MSVNDTNELLVQEVEFVGVQTMVRERSNSIRLCGACVVAVTWSAVGEIWLC